MHLQLEKNQIEKQEMDIHVHRLKDSISDHKKQYVWLLEEKKDLAIWLEKKMIEGDEMRRDLEDTRWALKSIELLNEDLQGKYNDCLKTQIKLQSEIKTLHGALADEVKRKGSPGRW